MKKTYLIFSLLFLMALTSCVSKKKFIYFQQEGDFAQFPNSYEPLLQEDDILSINVSSKVPEAVAPYNLQTKNIVQGMPNAGATSEITYLVDSQGNIEFPELGTIHVENFTVSQVRTILKDRISKFVTDAVITVKIMNFKISVLGEVARPGIISVQSQRLTLIEAIAMSGDLTLYGRRDNILIIRDSKGEKTYNRVDITNTDFINSPYYYLDQNDVIYVEPKKQKLDSVAIGPNVAIGLSLFASLAGIYLLIRSIK